MEERITAYIGQIEQMGGLVAAVERGWVHRELMGTAYQREQAITAGTRKVVGVNCYADGMPARVEIFRVPDALSRQTEKLKRLRATRDHRHVQRTLERLRCAAEAAENTVPPLLEAVKAGATLGECADVFRELQGGWLQPLL